MYILCKKNITNIIYITKKETMIRDLVFGLLLLLLASRNLCTVASSNLARKFAFGWCCSVANAHTMLARSCGLHSRGLCSRVLSSDNFKIERKEVLCITQGSKNIIYYRRSFWPHEKKSFSRSCYHFKYKL